MSDDAVRDFYEYLVGSAERNRSEFDKPIFMMAALQYMLKNNLHGLSFEEIMYQEHTRGIRNFFLRAGRQKLKNPENSWRRITNPRTSEMKKVVERYTSRRDDFDVSFSSMKPFQVKQLIDIFMNRIDVKED